MSKVATADQEAAVRSLIFNYSLSEASGPFRQFIARLNGAWESYNKIYFDSKMTPSAIFITPPVSPKAIADCALFSAYGGRHQIRIRPSVIDGTYGLFNPNHKVENRWLFIADILLHEMIHQMQHEVLNLTESGYQSHGKEYTNIANRIGETLGLPPVFIRRRRDKSIPLASQWPINVRPASYYGDLMKIKQDQDSDKPEHESESVTPQDVMTLALEAFKLLTADQHPEFIARSGIQLTAAVMVNNDNKADGVEDQPKEPSAETVMVNNDKPVKRKTKRAKTPDGCFSEQELINIINLNTDLTVLIHEFKTWIDRGLFPMPDRQDKAGDTVYWSQSIAQSWFDHIPDGCRDSSTTTAIKKSMVA